MNHDNDSLSPARDQFERYYTEKIWEWIPAIYRDEDGRGNNTGALRSMVEVLARQAAIARRSIDRLWEDQYIELCDDWAIPYIGELVGTRLVHELNRRGRRTDVARTIFYRRRKGTPLVLELLIRDIADWDGIVGEGFRRLARTRHGLDPEPEDLAGPITATPPGGWANLRSARGAERVDGPFDEYFHTPDFRQLRGKLGRYNIPKLNFHLFRLRPFEVNFATPVDLGAGRFTFDPSGRDIALFRPDQRPDPEQCHPPREWELPAPIPCRLLGDARYLVTAALIDELVGQGLSLSAADALSRYTGIPFRNEARMRETILSLDEGVAILSLFDSLLAGAITEDSPKAYLLPSPIQSDPSAVVVALGTDMDARSIDHQRIDAGNLEDWGASLGMLEPEKTLVIDPERGRFWFPTPPDEATSVWVPLYHYGFPGNIGAGIYERRGSLETNAIVPFPDGGNENSGPISLNVPASPLSGVFQFEDNKTYLPDGDVAGIHKLCFQAANFKRPYVKRVVPTGNEWVFTAAPKNPETAGESEPESNLRHLILNGLWIGVEQQGIGLTPTPCPAVPAALVLEGMFDRVVIQHCTLDSGGEQARIDPSQCRAIPYVQLVVRGTVEELVVESSILGPIVEDKVSGDPGTIQKLTIHDSIIQSIDPASVAAIETELGQVDFQSVTVLGDVRVNRMDASEALIQGVVRVTDNQHGCFRFSATNDAPDTELPRQFESHLFAPAIPNHFFVSRHFGDPGYAHLSDTALEAIVRGAENRSEIGAFSNLLNPIKLDDLEAKASEFMPFGLIAQFINET